MQAESEAPASPVVRLNRGMERVNRHARALAPLSRKDVRSRALTAEELAQLGELADEALALPARARRLWDNQDGVIMDDLDVERFDKELRSFLDESLAHVEALAAELRAAEAAGQRVERAALVGQAAAEMRQTRADILAKWLPFTAPRPAPVFDEARIAEARRAIARGEGMTLDQVIRDLEEHG